MQRYTLPEYLIPNSDQDILLYDYHAPQESSRQQVVLSHHTFSFLQEGEKEIIADHEQIAIDASNFLIMRAGHCLMTEKFSSTGSKYNSLLFFFSNESLLDFVKKHAISFDRQVSVASSTALPYDHFLRTFVLSLKDLEHMDSAIKNKMLTVKFEELMLYMIAREGVGVLSGLLGHDNQHSFDFVKMVEANKYNKLTLKQLAFLSNMSVSTFKRAFEKQYQESPIKWFQDQRLTYAAYLLKSKLRRPSDIYLETGYESLSNFIQAFKSKFGVTPKQYQTSGGM